MGRNVPTIAGMTFKFHRNVSNSNKPTGLETTTAAGTNPLPQ